MAKNSGKYFEQQFKMSVPDYCLLHRLRDSAQSFNQSNLTQFSWDNPCDFLLFDSISHILYCLELKSTKNKYMTFEDIESDEKQHKMIRKHQILSLFDFSKFENVIAGFIFNFRDEVHNMERTYFQDVESFIRMCKSIGKSSFNEIDLVMHRAVKIHEIKKRVKYYWNVDEFLKLKHE